MFVLRFLGPVLVSSMVFVVVMQDLLSLFIFGICSLVSLLLLTLKGEETSKQNSETEDDLLLADAPQNPSTTAAASAPKLEERGSDGLKDVSDEYKAAIKAAEILTNELRDETKAHWEHLVETNDKIKVLNHKSYKNCTLSIFKIPAEPLLVLDVLENVDGRTEWDGIMEETKCIKRINNATMLTYLKTKVQWPTSARDQVVIAHGKPDLHAREIVLVCTSVPYADIPKNSGVVRSNVILASYILTEDEGGTIVRAISYVDPKGYIPSRLLTFVNSVAVPQSFKRLRLMVKVHAASRTTNQEMRDAPTNASISTNARDQISDVKQLLSKIEKAIQRLRYYSTLTLVVAIMHFILSFRKIK